MTRVLMAFYAVVMRLAQPFLRRKLARRAVLEPGYGVAIEERFGRYTHAPEAMSELVWLHAVSLGETRTAAVLLESLRTAHPGLRVLLTHGTATGRAEGAALLRPGDVQVWQPWDSQAAVHAFFRHFKPRLGLLMETEIWPHLTLLAKTYQVPLVLVNARLSEKSLRQALRVAPLGYLAYAALAAVFAQTHDDARRFRQLGVVPQGVFGNLKFDANPSETQRSLGSQWRAALEQPVLMFASSRDGEELALFKEIAVQNQAVEGTLDANTTTVNAVPSVPSVQPVRYLVVPRHPQRFDEVEALASQQGLRVSRRSSWPGEGPAGSMDARQADIWLGDTLGEMALYYAISDVALLGGSFAPLGGQNLIEAAACGCPVVMGPSTFNFSEAAVRAEAAGAAQTVPDLPGGLRAAQRLVSHRAAQAAAASAGLTFAASHRGATRQTMEALAPYW